MFLNAPIPVHAAAVAVTERLREDAEIQEVLRMLRDLREWFGTMFVEWFKAELEHGEFAAWMDEHPDVQGPALAQALLARVPDDIKADVVRHRRADRARRGRIA